MKKSNLNPHTQLPVHRVPTQMLEELQHLIAQEHIMKFELGKIKA